jgi:hypothetical protein
VDDVNHCHQCLRELAARPPRPPGNSGPMAALLVAAACLMFFGVFWAVQGGLVP